MPWHARLLVTSEMRSTFNVLVGKVNERECVGDSVSDTVADFANTINPFGPSECKHRSVRHHDPFCWFH